MISIENFEDSLENLIILLKLPQSEVGTVLVNQKKEPLSYIVKDNDHIILIPVVGGG
jgi:molybdopterin converting factor small subunit